VCILELCLHQFLSRLLSFNGFPSLPDLQSLATNDRRAQESQQLEVERALAELRSENQALAFDREAAERARRAERDEADARRLAELRNETAVAAMELERSRDAQEREVGRLRLEREQELTRLALDAELATARARRDAAHEVALLEVEVDRLRAAIENERSPIAVQASLVDALPEIVGRLPKPTELRSVTVGGSDTTTLAGLVAQLTAVVAALRSGTES